LLIWKNPHGDAPPPTRTLQRVHGKWQRFATRFAEQVAAVYGSAGWQAMWSAIVERYHHLSFRDLVRLPELKGWSADNPGEFGGLGMTSDESAIFYVAGQALASLLGVMIWRRQWMVRGWYPTYIPIVSIVPAAVLTFGGDWQVVIGSALQGALVAPPLAVAISERLPGYMHGYIANVLAMALSTLVIVPVLGFLIGGPA
jgi:hypothetical protein